MPVPLNGTGINILIFNIPICYKKIGNTPLFIGKLYPIATISWSRIAVVISHHPVRLVAVVLRLE